MHAEGSSVRPPLETREDPPPDLSVLILASERPEPLADFYREIIQPLRSSGRSLECVFAVEPRFRHLTDEVRKMDDTAAPVRVLVAGQSMGETGLVRMALANCRAPVLLILSAYRRVQAAALPDLIRALDGADLVLARRWPRRDSWLNRLQGGLFHRLAAWLTDSRFHDMASGVRAVRRELLGKVPLYGDFYRFLPVFAAREGYRVLEIACPQHPNDVRARLYRPGVYLRRAMDLFGLAFLVRFTEKPLRFFGMVGSIFALSGAGILALVFVQRIAGQPAADRPLLLLGVLLLALGIQVIALGLVGEIIVHVQAARYRRYRVVPVRTE